MTTLRIAQQKGEASAEPSLGGGFSQVRHAEALRLPLFPVPGSTLLVLANALQSVLTSFVSHQSAVYPSATHDWQWHTLSRFVLQGKFMPTVPRDSAVALWLSCRTSIPPSSCVRPKGPGGPKYTGSRATLPVLHRPIKRPSRAI